MATRFASINKKVLTFLTGIAVFLLLLCELVIISDVQLKKVLPAIDANAGLYKTILDGDPIVRKTPKILFYTSFFGSMVYTGDPACTACTVTNDKTKISSADAVVYHMVDTTWVGATYFYITGGLNNWFSFPEYRRADQVWVLYNLEPLSMVMKFDNIDAWDGIFNWTWSYSRAADVVAPYGSKRKLTVNETLLVKNDHSISDFDYFGAKVNTGGVAMISHCTDDARRYNIISTLRQFIDIRVLGRCGEGCPHGYQSCNKTLLAKFKFYLAFENSDCYDYVSEKYWRALERGQVPIVAWKLNMSDVVIPNSYINVYEFPDLNAAGRYIQLVRDNRTLYNSYFRWRTEYRIQYVGGLCELCRKLQDKHVPRRVYNNIHGWIHNNTCQPPTVCIY